MRAVWRNLWLTLGLSMAAQAHAHTGGTSYVDVQMLKGAQSPQLQVDVPLPDLAAALGLAGDADGVVRWRDLLAAGSDIATYLQTRLQLTSAGQPCPSTAILPPLLVDRDTGRHLRVVMTVDCRGREGSWSLDARTWFADVDDQGIYVTWDGSGERVALLTKDQSATPLNAVQQQGFARFWVLGVEHLLTGYDHLAFLALLLLGAVGKTQAATGLRSLLWETAKIATAFTVAHSITLVLAATGTLRVPAAPVEIAIAGSIFLTAVAVMAGAGRWVGWPLAFGFGLVHGLGFANVLADILTGRNLLTPLLGFNLGIEVAQLLVIALVAPLLWQALARPRLWQSVSMSSAVLLAGMSVIWMTERWP